MKKQRKLNKQQLEQVLSAHTAGQLKRSGSNDWKIHKETFDTEYPLGVGCLTQVAFNNPQQNIPKNLLYDIGTKMQSWFDGNYSEDWTAEEFVEQLSLKKFI